MTEAPDWEANPDATAEVGTERFAEYQANVSRTIPVIAPERAA
jgi:hypothetical protein